MSQQLHVIIVSTRPGRAGKPIADWFVKEAQRDGRFDIEVTDLAELALPPLDEPHPPRFRNYVNEHTRAWSRMVEESDAFVLVMPEYNHGFAASIKNAIDYLHDEWAHKPVGFVSYGGISAGMRAVQMLKPVLSCLRMIPVTDQVALANHVQFLDGGVFAPGEPASTAATVMLDDLERTMHAIGQLRSATA
jgi:NAD(P)H-dependent FMN reductase